MKQYAIWDKVSPIITPDGKVWTADQWKEKYPVAALESITVLCAAGEINGAIFGTLGQMVQRYESEGCDLSTCTTDEEKLEAIEAFIEAQEKEQAEKQAQERAEAEAMARAEIETTERIAAALEYQNAIAE